MTTQRYRIVNCGRAQVLAIKVLLEHVRDLDRAHEYASKVRRPRSLCSSSWWRLLWVLLSSQSSQFRPNAALTNAEQVDEPDVWSEVGHSQLEHNNVADAIECYLRANDSSRYILFSYKSCCSIGACCGPVWRC